MESISVPKLDDPLHPAWKQCNDTVMTWILNVLTQSIAQSVICLNTAKDI